MSCSSEDKSGFLTIPVDSDEETSLKLSEITDGSIEAIELELTDQSLVGERITRVLCGKDYIIICERKSIMQFDKTGKFIRKIASVGQGPGEFTSIGDITMDSKNKKIFIKTNAGKMMSYDFDGNFIRESSNEHYREHTKCLNYINNKLLYLSETGVKDESETRNLISLYTIDSNLLKTDSVNVRSFVHNGFWIHPFIDFITYDGKNTYLYYSDISTNPVVLDTLYRIKDKQLIPYLNLNFKNRGLSVGGGKDIYLFNIYRSSRYIFAIYNNELKNPEDTPDKFSSFCYDTKTGKGYNMQGGYFDDIHTGKKVRIRPFHSDSNKFYYLYTEIDENTVEEPNPTLYIGELKR
jgi:hypothetical protein